MTTTTAWAAPGAKTVHLAVQDSATNLAWCGARRQFRHRNVPGGLGAVTCPTCLTAKRQGRPRAWRK